MNDIRVAAEELIAILPYYISTARSDERGAYFRGLMTKAADSLIAIDLLLESTGPIWPLHCRWIVEALGYASALKEDEKTLAQIKRLSADTYLLVTGVDDAARKKKLESISLTPLPHIEILLRKFEVSAGAVETGLLYKIYRLLCEYTHFEFHRTIAYPAFGGESPQDLEKRKDLFLKIAVTAALSLPSFAHCPPSCRFDDAHFEKVIMLRDRAWTRIRNWSADAV